MKIMALLLLVLAVTLGDAVKANGPAKTVPDDLLDSSDNKLSFHEAVPTAEKVEWTKDEVAEAAEVASLQAEVADAEEQLKQTAKDMKKATSEAFAASASARAKLHTTEQKAREEAATGKMKTGVPVKLAEADRSQKTEIMKAARAAEKAAAVADEVRRAEAAKKAAEAAQMAEAAKKAEEAKKMAEQNRLLAATRAANMKKKMKAEEARKAWELKENEASMQVVEAARAADMKKKIKAEEARKAWELKEKEAAMQVVEAARKAQEAKRAESSKKVEAAIQAANKAAEETRKAREAKMAEEAKHAEAAKKYAEAAKKAKKDAASAVKKAEASNRRPVIIDQDEAKDITGDVTKVGEDQAKKAQEEAKKASEEAKKAEVVKKLEDEAAKKAEEIKKASAEKKAVEASKNTKEPTKTKDATEEVSIKSHEAQQVSYGNPKCQCIGFSGVQGNRLVMLGGKFVEFPGDLGSSCEAWDDGVHPACQAGTKPGKGKDWCAQPWCFVDPRKCDIQELPEMSTYMPTARYQKMPLFVSRSTCDKKPFSAVAGPLGFQKCGCIGFDNAPGSMKFQISDASVTYPAETGGTCGAWDMNSNPLCAVKGDKPDFCSKKWCFVDPCSCDIGRPPKVSAALFDASFAGKKVYYSYETCADMDVYTSKFNKKACIIEKTQDDCSKKSHCSWTGSKCLGKELVDKAVCGASPAKDAATEKSSAHTERSSAHQQGMFGAMVAVLLLSSF